MSRRRQLYILAFVAYTTALTVTASLAWLVSQHNLAAGIAQFSISMSGNALGGFALVLGILRDDRADRERERAQRAEESAKESDRQTAEARRQTEQALKQADELRQQAERERQQAEHERQKADRAEAELRQQAAHERQRAERAEAELRRLREEQSLEARFRRLEEALGLPPVLDTENNPTTEQ